MEQISEVLEAAKKSFQEEVVRKTIRYGNENVLIESINDFDDKNVYSFLNDKQEQDFQ